MRAANGRTWQEEEKKKRTPPLSLLLLFLICAVTEVNPPSSFANFYRTPPPSRPLVAFSESEGFWLIACKALAKI